MIWFSYGTLIWEGEPSPPSKPRFRGNLSIYTYMYTYGPMYSLFEFVCFFWFAIVIYGSLEESGAPI